ncbi:Hypothetical protein CINCED_3A013815 [Cinara cedri]|uniref:Uncharacterized protein n=1 Tax=Cinara cedri TaxID=506608 RepID=A0A5E4MLR1_9HEMI|nr:Hypothetical protein CINCED_3A013815 [Cinara cedri]
MTIRPTLPLTKPIISTHPIPYTNLIDSTYLVASKSTSNLNQALTPHQMIIPSMGMPGVVSKSNSHLEQTLTPHQIIMPSMGMPGIAYQIYIGNHNENYNNSVQYAMQPMFLQ